MQKLDHVPVTKKIQYNVEYEQREPLTRNQYLLRNLLVGTLGETLVHKLGYAGSLSATDAFNTITKKIDDLTGFQSWMPFQGANQGANSEEIEDTMVIEESDEDMDWEDVEESDEDMDWDEVDEVEEEVDTSAPKNEAETVHVDAEPPVSGPVQGPTEAPNPSPVESDVNASPVEPDQQTWSISDYLPEMPKMPKFSFFGSDESPVISSATTPVETATAINSTWGDSISGFVKSSYDEATSFGSRNWNAISGYVSDNGDWLALAATMAITTSAANYMLKNKLRNSYQRNVASVLLGSVAVWGTSFAVSYLGYTNPIELKKTFDVGTRVMGYVATLHYGRGLFHFASKTARPITNWACQPASFVIKKSK